MHSPMETFVRGPRAAFTGIAASSAICLAELFSLGVKKIATLKAKPLCSTPPAVSLPSSVVASLMLSRALLLSSLSTTSRERISIRCLPSASTGKDGSFNSPAGVFRRDRIGSVVILFLCLFLPWDAPHGAFHSVGVKVLVKGLPHNSHVWEPHGSW